MLKKVTLAVMGLAASGLASAGSMGPVCAPGNVTVPCVAQHWEFGVQALYLQPGFSATDAFLTPVHNYFNQAYNTWDWGYRLEGAYQFNTGNDVTVNWTHYRNTVNQAENTPLDLIPLGMGAFPYIFSSEDRLDQVNVVMGQHVDVSAVKKMRFYAGLQYAHIQINADNYTGDVLVIPRPTPPTLMAPAPGSYNFSQYSNSDYKGVGPTIGIDYAYLLTNAFSVTANGSGSILYGTNIYSDGITWTEPNVVVASAYAKKRAIVPSLEAKLGVNYAYNMAQGQWNVQAGYEVLNYFKAIQTQGVFGLAGVVTNSNYGVYGPYIGLNYVGNV